MNFAQQMAEQAVAGAKQMAEDEKAKAAALVDMCLHPDNRDDFTQMIMMLNDVDYMPQELWEYDKLNVLFEHAVADLIADPTDQAAHHSAREVLETIVPFLEEYKANECFTPEHFWNGYKHPTRGMLCSAVHEPSGINYGAVRIEYINPNGNVVMTRMKDKTEITKLFNCLTFRKLTDNEKAAL